MATNVIHILSAIAIAISMYVRGIGDGPQAVCSGAAVVPSSSIVEVAAVVVDSGGAGYERVFYSCPTVGSAENDRHHDLPLQDYATVVRSNLHYRRRGRKGKRGAIYARFSTKYQASIQDQIRACREWAEANDIDVDDNLIFFDEAVSGKKSRRTGLDLLRKALAENKIDVLVVFATNRLHRNGYKARQFIEEELVDNGIRCVCIRSGVDTADLKRWRLMHGVNAIVDEAMLQGTADQVREAHRGLLLAGLVFGTLTFGYTGQEIPGQLTRMKRPRRRIIIDPVSSVWVKKIFDWYINGNLSIHDIVLKVHEENAPKPPRSAEGWTELAVRRILSNHRYLGWWAYGLTRTVWLNKKDYGKQEPQEKPLAEKSFPELQIIDEATFAKAQELLGKKGCHAGRKGRRVHPRHRILNGQLWCPVHDHALNHGTRFYCRECRRSPQPALVSNLSADLAVRAICRKLVELIKVDNDLVIQVISAFRRCAEMLQKPDMSELPALEHQDEKLTRSINMLQLNPGESERDMEESAENLRKLRGERAAIRSRIEQLKALADKVVTVPTETEVQTAVQNMTTALEAAVAGEDPADAQKLRQIIVDLTGGRIVCTQQGERRTGWLRGTFRLRLLKPFLGAMGAEATEDSMPEVTVEFRDETLLQQRAEQVKAMFDQNLMMADIAIKLGLPRNVVTGALQHWYHSRGLTPPDGRTRRSSLSKKHLVPPLYQKIAEQVMELYQQGLLLHQISQMLKVDRNTITQTVAFWHRSQGLPVPDGRGRRKTLEHKSDPPRSPQDPPTDQGQAA